LIFKYIECNKFDFVFTDSAKTLKILLSFAVGGLLGDVFLHLLPEAWNNYDVMYTGKFFLNTLYIFTLYLKIIYKIYFKS
jgi:hypothetical protein